MSVGIVPIMCILFRRESIEFRSFSLTYTNTHTLMARERELMSKINANYYRFVDLIILGAAPTNQMNFVLSSRQKTLIFRVASALMNMETPLVLLIGFLEHEFQIEPASKFSAQQKNNNVFIIKLSILGTV